MPPSDRAVLLAPSEHDEIAPVQPVHRTPLPVGQLALLIFMRVTEPISYTIIFPFINQMLEEMEVTKDPKQVGYYAGFIESLFSVAQLCTALFWGRLSDKVGRKPVMLTGLLGVGVSVTLFGLQKSYLGLLVARFIAGMMNGNVAILQCMISEITDSTNFADAVSYLPITFAVGNMIGPIIGGCLARPAQEYPRLFGNSQFLNEFPYFLPCLVAGLLNLVAIAAGFLFLEETLASKRQPRPCPDRAAPGYGTVPTESEENIPPVVLGEHELKPPPSIKSLCTRPVMMLFLTVSIMHLQNMAWTAILPLYGYTSKQDGGLGLSLQELGFMLSTTGIGCIIVQLWAFSPLVRRFGPLKLFKFTNPFFTSTYFIIPFVTYLVRWSHATNTTIVGYMAVVLTLRTLGVMSYVCSLMLTNMMAPCSSALGTLNGMNQTSRALAQAVGPVLGTSLFAASISTHFLGGNLVWVVMALISLTAQAFLYTV